MKEEKTIVLNHRQIEQRVTRIAYELYENNAYEEKIVLVGILPGGAILSDKIVKELESISPLKISFVQLTLNKKEPLENEIQINVTGEMLKNKVVVLIDDVLNSGKTLMYAASFLIQYPVKKLSTVVLVDRIHRKFPIRADFVGLSLSTTLKQYINVEFKEGQDTVFLQ